MPKRRPERTLYPLVQRWLKRHFACFRTSINKGLQHSRIDIVGVRDTGGDLSGEVETIAIEVKRGSVPFANACGQTLDAHRGPHCQPSRDRPDPDQEWQMC